VYILELAELLDALEVLEEPDPPEPDLPELVLLTDSPPLPVEPDPSVGSGRPDVGLLGRVAGVVVVVTSPVFGSAVFVTTLFPVLSKLLRESTVCCAVPVTEGSLMKELGSPITV
jgi:hypothetical protein